VTVSVGGKVILAVKKFVLQQVSSMVEVPVAVPSCLLLLHRYSVDSVFPVELQVAAEVVLWTCLVSMVQYH
jgi:hypothetical protein